MAEVEITATTAADIPATTTTAMTAATSVEEVTAGNLGTSPTQERSSNSHPHSEYDTASDLDGADDYDDEEEDDDEDDSLSGTDNDDDEEDDENEIEYDGLSVNHELKDAALEAQKKVDEDRSNPQYIPKRGTFYEHDDRTADVEETLVGNSIEEDGELSDTGAGVTKTRTSSVKSGQTPMISQASKTMKKWQPASGVERWSHDRFNATEQAPKSRSELVCAYGYDIRTEDAPPRARRRRRYGRGPNKYSRNWEDENAYLKQNNKERKLPRPSEFPALNERKGVKERKDGTRRVREEKENRRSSLGHAASSAATAIARNENNRSERERERDRDRDRALYADERKEQRGEDKMAKTKNYSRQNGPNSAVAVRQAAMEFKNKQRNVAGVSPRDRINEHERPSMQNTHDYKDDVQQQQQRNVGNRSNMANMKQMPITAAPLNESFNNSLNSKIQESASTNFQNMAHQQQQNMQLHQVTAQKTLPPTNLTQRLQQVQQRNDPSHVGSIQMHALASQNQLAGQQQQLHQPQASAQAANVILAAQQQQQQQQQLSLEQRAGPKRYSSLRRSQHEAQHLAEQQQQQQQQQQQLQQLHMQQPPIMLQEQHMMQANIMQLYHQENMQAVQAQMQAMQVGQGAATSKTPYGNVSQPPPNSASGNQPYNNAAQAAPPAAYFVTTDAYGASAAVNAPPPAQAAAYTQQPPPTTYMPQPAAAMPYANVPPPNTQPVPVAVPVASTAAAVYAQATPNASVPAQATANNNANFGNYQNYNTVGGTTYFVPPPAQANTRPVVLPQRRPTNAIPILPPAEKNRPQATKEDTKNVVDPSADALDSAENIDHIIDNMFVQRPAYQPPTVQPRKETTSAANEAANEYIESKQSTSNEQQSSSPTPEQQRKISEDRAVPTTATVAGTAADNLDASAAATVNE